MKDIRHVVFHRPGPKWDHQKAPFDQEGLQGHVDHYRKLLADGKLALGGPFLDAASGGMMVPVATMTEEEVRDYAEADPAVKSGLLELEVRSWLITTPPRLVFAQPPGDVMNNMLPYKGGEASRSVNQKLKCPSTIGRPSVTNRNSLSNRGLRSI